MDADERLDQRRRAHHALATRLAGMSDAAVAELLTDPDPSRASMNGNASEVIEVEGEKVFVKKIALTDLERSAGEGATANLFNLPLFCRYELGFGAWRELSACLRASAWTLSGECALFPLVHHWRVLPRTPTPGAPELQARLQRALDHWDRSEAIAARVNALLGRICEPGSVPPRVCASDADGVARGPVRRGGARRGDGGGDPAFPR